MDVGTNSFLDLLDRGLDRAKNTHFLFDELRREVELRRWHRPSRDDQEFYALVRDALNRGWSDVADWEKWSQQRACVRSILDRIDWELRLLEMCVHRRMHKVCA